MTASSFKIYGCISALNCLLNVFRFSPFINLLAMQNACVCVRVFVASAVWTTCSRDDATPLWRGCCCCCCSMKPPLATCHLYHVEGDRRARRVPQLKDNLLRCRRRLLWISKLAEAKSTRSVIAISFAYSLPLFHCLWSFVSRSIETGCGRGVGVANVWGKCLGHNCSRLGRVIDTLMRRHRLGVCILSALSLPLYLFLYAKRR